MMPHDEILEKQLLGVLVTDREALPEVQDLLHPDLFYVPANKVCCKAILALKNDSKHIDLIALGDWIKKNGLREQCPDTYLYELPNSHYMAGLREKVMILVQFHIRRTLILKSHQIINSAQEVTCDPFELIGEQEKNLTELVLSIQVSQTYDALDCHNELLDHIQKISKLNDGEFIGIDTGFYDLNYLTAGWQKSDLVILAGRPGMGKTSFALNTTGAALASNVPVLFFSLEMPKMQLYARMCSQITSMPIEKFLRKKMDGGETAIFHKETYRLSQSPFYVDDRGGLDINKIKMKCRKLKREKGIGLIIIDHVGKIKKPNNRKSTNDQVGEITDELKTLAKELDVPIIALCQLNRGSEDNKDKRPTLRDLRDSGNIEQDADSVIFIYRPEYYGITDDGTGRSTVGKAEIIIEKNRNGPLESVFAGFVANCTNFYDLKAAESSARQLESNSDFLAL